MKIKSQKYIVEFICDEDYEETWFSSSTIKQVLENYFAPKYLVAVELCDDDEVANE